MKLMQLKILLLMLSIFWSCSKRCVVKHPYSDDYPTPWAVNFVPYKINSSFKMLYSSGDTLTYICTSRSLVLLSTYVDELACEEEQQSCNFAKYINCDSVRSYGIVTPLKCLQTDSMSIDFSFQDGIEMTFKNPLAYSVDAGISEYNTCAYGACLPSYSINGIKYTNVLALNAYGNLIDSIYYNKDFGILRIKFTDGNSLIRIN
jgi:hypothetical protein